MPVTPSIVKAAYGRAATRTKSTSVNDRVAAGNVAGRSSTSFATRENNANVTQCLADKVSAMPCDVMPTL